MTLLPEERTPRPWTLEDAVARTEFARRFAEAFRRDEKAADVLNPEPANLRRLAALLREPEARHVGLADFQPEQVRAKVSASLERKHTPTPRSSWRTGRRADTATSRAGTSASGPAR